MFNICKPLSLLAVCYAARTKWHKEMVFLETARSLISWLITNNSWYLLCWIVSCVPGNFELTLVLLHVWNPVQPGLRMYQRPRPAQHHVLYWFLDLEFSGLHKLNFKLQTYVDSEAQIQKGTLKNKSWSKSICFIINVLCHLTDILLFPVPPFPV